MREDKIMLSKNENRSVIQVTCLGAVTRDAALVVGGGTRRGHGAGSSPSVTHCLGLCVGLTPQSRE